MYTPEENNVKLTDEQLKAIEMVQHRLTVLQNEVTSATKVLNSIKNDSVVAVRDLAYQNDLLATVTAQVKEAKDKLNVLNETNANLTESNSKLGIEIASKNAELSTKEAGLADKENTILEKENGLSNKKAWLDKSVREFTEEKEEFNAKVAKLKEVISIL